MLFLRPNTDVPRVPLTVAALSIACAGLAHGQDSTRTRRAATARDSVQRLRTVEVVASRGGLFGLGQTWQDQRNAKIQYFAGPHQIVGYYGLSDRTENDYTDLSLARWRSSGRDWDQYSNWATAVTAAQSTAPDEAYYNTAQGARRDHLGYVKGMFRLADGARLEVQPYVHTNKGAGDWTAPSYGSSWSPDPIFFRQTQYGSLRYRTNAKATFELPGNELEIGGWFEHNESTIRRVGWRLKSFAAGPDVDFSNVLRLFFDRTGTYNTTLGYIQNTNRLMNGRLKLSYGFKHGSAWL